MTDLMLDADLAPEQRECLLVARQSCDLMMGVVDDILNFSQIESGRLELESIQFNMRLTFEDTFKTLSVRAVQKKFNRTASIGPGIPESVLGDPGRLRQIIVNLVGNAIKFTDQGEVGVSVGIEPSVEGSCEFISQSETQGMDSLSKNKK
jgi:two-component system, sensor histidine kinase and response regulator